MLGNAVFRLFASDSRYQTLGTVRTGSARQLLPLHLQHLVLSGLDISNVDSLVRLLSDARPNIVINCIGVIKQLISQQDPLDILPINAIFPHRLARLCAISGARLVHFSTDCVFSGATGMYIESDIPDSNDIYGRSKLLGEVTDGHAITLRTSIVGHELNGAHGLVDWFLSQAGEVNGFTKAIFSGLPAIEIAKIIRDHVIPNTDLHGLFHLAADPISKHDLLLMLATHYRHSVNVIPCSLPAIDRSLNGTKFNQATGFRPKPWQDLIQTMYDFR